MKHERFLRHIPVYAFVLMVSFLVMPLTACSTGEDVGGPLPTLATEWTEEPDVWPEPTVSTETRTRTDAPLVVSPATDAVGDDWPVTRAVAAKMLALTYCDLSTIDAMDWEITFTDVDASSWYAKYINAVCVRGLMAGAGQVFMPDEPLTLGQAYALLSSLDSSRTPGVTLTDENRERPVSYALWVELYKKLLESVSGDRTVYEAFGIEAADVIVMAAVSNNPSLSEGQMIADSGAFTHAGLDIGTFIDREIRVYHKNKEIIALVAVGDEQPTLRNVYISDIKENGITVFSGGAQRFYTYANGCEKLPSDAVGRVCDMTIGGGEVFVIHIADDTLTGTILRTTDRTVELKEYGTLPIDARFKVYSVANGAVKWKSLTNLLVGAEHASFYIRDGVVRAAVITQNVQPERIRVVIGTSDYAGLIHNSVTVTSTVPFTVRAGRVETTFEAGRRFTVSDIENTDLFGAERLYITADEPDGTLQMIGLKRNWTDNASPRYRGTIEIARENGGYSVVNELPMEEYLYAVVPSEMPSGYGVEVSKAQAVTARSYAYNQFYENRYHAYGGHVDDSVSCQVYNNIPSNNISIESVDATRGQCLTYNGAVISANFFSTSSGYTANGGEVWPSAGVFPASSAAYLRAKPQYEGTDYGDLTIEENAARFFKDTAVDAYDQSFSWFRWQVRMTAEEIAASVNANINTRWQASPALIKSSQADTGENALIASDVSSFRSRSIDSIGTLTDLSVIKRGEGGNIMALLVVGTDASALVLTEYNIRMLLKPMRYIAGGRDITLTRADGSTVTNYSLMPSAFFTFDLERDENGTLVAVTFYGGGNGHGVGMSQNGVKGMIDRGYTYEDAMQHYYPGTEVKTLY